MQGVLFRSGHKWRKVSPLLSFTTHEVHYLAMVVLLAAAAPKEI
jgi:hypothetical protein